MWRRREFRPEAHRTAGPEIEINPPMAMAIPANQHRSALRTRVRGSAASCASHEAGPESLDRGVVEAAVEGDAGRCGGIGGTRKMDGDCRS